MGIEPGTIWLAQLGLSPERQLLSSHTHIAQATQAKNSLDPAWQLKDNHLTFIHLNQKRTETCLYCETNHLMKIGLYACARFGYEHASKKATTVPESIFIFGEFAMNVFSKLPKRH